jgi:hypothetical protein
MRLKCLAVATLSLLLAFSKDQGRLRFTTKGEMIFPADYREWVWLSSGLGMSYTAASQANNPDFDNVFVSPEAYRSFMATGKWPDGVIFMLEVRGSHNRGSINQSGHYQGGVEDVEAHVKDNGKWAFYSFGKDTKPGHLFPASASCYSCHEQHAAVDTTFVQFYPTLIEVARQKKTLNEKALTEDKK